MDYPGNATLTREMQERILSTFKQTLTAASAGNRQEAKLGCDFILRLDSLFGPARQLLERMEVGQGPVETADLEAAIGMAAGESPAATPEVPAATDPSSPPETPQAGTPPPVEESPVDELDDLDLGLDEPEADAPLAGPEPIAAGPPAPEPAPPAEPPAIEPPPPAEPEAAEPPPPTEPPAVEPPPPIEPDAIEPTPPAEPAAAEPTPPAEPEALEPPPAAEPPPVEPPPPVEAEAAEPEVPAEPEAPAEAALDELDDLDLSAAAKTPPEAIAQAEAPPPEAEPEEAPAAAEAGAEPEPAEAPEAESPEEEAPAEPAAAAPPESVEIPLDSEPAAQLDSESQQRVEDLLAEGQEAFDAGEYQGAIDAWSRIFLIDIDHAEANERIEEARRLKAEADRKVEEKFHEGLSQLEAGETDAAADSFRAVLEMQSSHLQARDYLEKLEAGEVPVPAEVPRAADTEPEEGEVEGADRAAEMEGEEPSKPKPDRGTKAVGERVVTVKKSPFKSKRFLAIAAAGLIAVLGGAWYLFNNWSSLFPNSAQEAPVQVAADPLARAQALHDEGKTPIAIAQLRRLPPDSPQYDEAQALIAQWELERAPTDQGPQGPSPEEMARREALVAEAGAAAELREFMRTSELLSEAATIAPLSGAEVQLLARADEQLRELQNFITIFREGEWDMALRDLWLLHEADPGNRDVTRLLVDSYYNLGLRALQRKDVKQAAEQFSEALGLSPDDPELLRLADFAATYQTRSTDLLYRIFVKYHPFR